MRGSIQDQDHYEKPSYVEHNIQVIYQIREVYGAVQQQKSCYFVKNFQSLQ